MIGNCCLFIADSPDLPILIVKMCLTYKRFCGLQPQDYPHTQVYCFCYTDKQRDAIKIDGGNLNIHYNLQRHVGKNAIASYERIVAQQCRFNNWERCMNHALCNRAITVTGSKPNIMLPIKCALSHYKSINSQKPYHLVTHETIANIESVQALPSKME